MGSLNNIIQSGLSEEGKSGSQRNETQQWGTSLCKYRADSLPQDSQEMISQSTISKLAQATLTTLVELQWKEPSLAMLDQS